MTDAPGPDDWNQRIIEEFRANSGRVGGPFEGAPMVLLHHVGARTGTARVNPLVCFPDGDDLVIVASKAGAPTNPDWYHNLMAHPRAEVELGTERFAVDATEVTGADRATLWERVVEATPGFADYQRNTDRVIPVLRLSRAASVPPS
jgi:deazaflavin-dependent oxidoreductase (nitroreductase family)